MVFLKVVLFHKQSYQMTKQQYYNKNDIPLKNDKIINQMMRFRMIVLNDSLDSVQQSLFAEYTIFKVQVTHKLDLSMAHIEVILFEQTKEHNFENYGNSGVELKLNLITVIKMSQERKNVGHLSVSLKDYVDFSSGRKISLIFFS